MDGQSIFLGLGGGRAQRLVLSRADRHGLIAGWTGPGKTVTIQTLGVGLSAGAGARAGADSDKAAAAAAKGQARLERERRANPPLFESMAREVGKSVQRQAVNRVAGSIGRGLPGGLFRGR